MESESQQFERLEFTVDGIDFHALTMGEGPLVLCLHGFPDHAYTFDRQLPVLAGAGYRAVAPFLRGYGPTGPSAEGTYQTAALARDVVGMVDALGAETAHLLGHDWGALAAYGAAVLAPERFGRLLTVAVPYGPTMASAFVSNYAQLKRSWYIFFFQSMFAETAVEAEGYAFIRRLWDEWSPGRGWPEERVGPVLETLARPGVLEAAIGYYRCMLDPSRQDPELAADQMRVGVEPIELPTLYVHGARDGCMGLEMSDGMEAVFPAGLRKEVFAESGHFLHLEEPERFNELLLSFLAGAEGVA